MEVEAAAQAAEEDAAKAREQALDPAVVVDVASVGATVATATLTRDRLQAALPRLQERLKEVREREDARRVEGSGRELEGRRDGENGWSSRNSIPRWAKRIADHLDQHGCFRQAGRRPQPPPPQWRSRLRG